MSCGEISTCICVGDGEVVPHWAGQQARRHGGDLNLKASLYSNSGAERDQA